ncbi:MAG: ribokinase [Pseudorhodobacter sp.]
MTVYNLGSINIDHVYQVPHITRPGETLTSTGYAQGLGGKGANQSVAAARAGARVIHIGAIGPNSDWVIEMLAGFNIDTSGIAKLAVATGHAIITVDSSAENAITLYPGANREITGAMSGTSLRTAEPGDLLLMQNETTGQVETAQIAAQRGLRLLYSPAPFELEPLKAVLPFTHLLLMNEGEAEDLRTAMGELPEVALIVTRGAKGASWITPGETPLTFPAFQAEAVDTTGAGDCFAGNIAAALDAGLPREQAMRRALAAASIQVTQPGAAQAMPDLPATEALLAAL